MSTAEVAAVFGVPHNHLSKIVGELANGGFIDTFRGKGGGSTLAMPLGGIRIGAVVRHLEGEKEMVNCARPLCPGLPACRLTEVMHQAKMACLEVLDDYSLGDVPNDRTQALSELLIPPQPLSEQRRTNA